ncbi:MAG: cytochrome c oxidase subunit II [Nitrospiraceae bacterium]|nr:MAG: cytochrome c oxidase subunit II [Nitrospiraceae bacterium]
MSLIHKLTDGHSRGLLPRAHLDDKGSYSAVKNLPELVNDAFSLVIVISLVLLVLVTFFTVFFAVKYRRKKNPVPHEVKEPLILEITWTVIPTILVLIMFWAGWVNFVPLRRIPENAMPVKVNARMWSWQFEYENGRTSPTLNVPLGRPVKLLLHSSDVIHSFYIPEFRIKEDVVPGMENFLWINADREGEFDIFCAEYCGRGHSGMISKVVVMSSGAFHEWYEKKEEKHAAAGELSGPALMEKHGCLDCHSIDGSALVGPTFKGLFGRSQIVVTGGREMSMIADEAYIRKSILHPSDEVVKGYPDIMPSFEEDMNEEEISAVIGYLKGLK